MSLNKKFETVHLVRHFNAWHASSHECAGKWPPNSKSTKLPLSDQDFAIVGINLAFPKTIQFQCIWCAAFMDRKVDFFPI